jgi:hypothetical protein
VEWRQRDDRSFYQCCVVRIVEGWAHSVRSGLHGLLAWGFVVP